MGNEFHFKLRCQKCAPLLRLKSTTGEETSPSPAHLQGLPRARAGAQQAGQRVDLLASEAVFGEAVWGSRYRVSGSRLSFNIMT